MQTIDDIAREIVKREGGYVNDPNDPGGATNHGVTIHTMRRLGLDITGDGRIDVQDVKSLSQAEAIEIFKNHYYVKPRIGDLPSFVQASVFDMYVNSGSNAVKILQRLLAKFGQTVTIDGGLGPQTLAAANVVAKIAPKHFADAYGIARRNYYYSLADSRPASRKYARTRSGGKGGWIRRAEDFISEKYHLSANEHKRRCEKWV